ncbi:MAG: TAXI family TRAP transporter solute-binding subunit, partial [Candidatus Thiodiazotropha endolucinida]|nr:TAXI family TRAP transporter solute-binding subunit [Candidatus Thiodiazotropha taylori]MCW4241949.1 TAXI family TRAP transporter solute-binding subunit [Candidatus Thiodiazotropha taylori]
AATACDTHLVAVDGDLVEKLIETTPYYAPATVAGGIYRGSDNDTPTFGVKATLVTAEHVDEEVVYQLVKTVFDNLDKFRQLHPAFAHLQAADMLQGNSAPFHKGAMRYYKEKGWL